jgi:Glycosyltransferase WbsX
MTRRRNRPAGTLPPQARQRARARSRRSLLNDRRAAGASDGGTTLAEAPEKTCMLDISAMHQTLRGEASLKPSIRLLAYYLPQFHPIPENDRWWGAGFTEWTNVTRAKPLFRGHYQPRLPRDLGFYDLRVPETRERQAELARDAGIEGFCYWHYWFGNGRRILDRPFEEVLNSGKPDFPFCLSWANQTWSGIWYGEPKRTLIEQTYPGPEDEKAHFDWALPAFRDHRYVRIDGKPVFLVYDPHSHPDPTSFIAHWQRLAFENGLPGIHFIAMSNDVDRPWLVPFDSITQFGPTDFLQDWPTDLLKRAKRRLRRRDLGPLLNRLAPRHFGLPQRHFAPQSRPGAEGPRPPGRGGAAPRTRAGDP